MSAADADRRIPPIIGELQRSLDEHPCQSAEEAVGRCLAAGLEPVGAGRHRLCAALSGLYVAKFAWRPRGIADNMIEARLYESAQPPLREVLCPVVELIDQRVLVMRRCVPMHPEALADARTVARLAATQGVTDAIGNLGLLDGRTVIYDYALVAPAHARALLGQNPPMRFTAS